MPKKRHIHGGTEISSRSVYQPDVTADAEVRLERLSADPSSGLWNDITSNGNNGTATTPSTLADFYFNATGASGNEMVDLASTNSVCDPTASFTITCWAKNESDAGDSVILLATRQQTSSSKGWKVQDFPGASPDPDYEWVSTNAAAARFGPLLPEAIGAGWKFFAVTWEPGTPNVVKGYADGALYGTVNPGTFDATTQPLRLFRGIYPGNSWTGYFDTVRVYNRILSPDEILRDYNAGKPAHP